MAIGNTLRAILGLDNKQFNKGLKEAESKVKSFGSSIKKIAATGAILAIGRQLVGVAKEASLLAAKGEGIRAAFAKLNDPRLLEDLRDATRNTVADIDLMSAAVRANNFHISLKALPRYFEFAQQRARATGESVDYLVESIVMGIGRKSAMILDNLGISLADINEELKKTPDYATAVGNIMDREMAKAGDATSTTMDSIEQLNAAMANLKEGVGDVINDVLAKPLANTAKSLGDVLKGVADLKKELEMGGVNKEIANQIRGNIAMASGTAGGYFMANLFGGRKAGKGEILIQEATPITKTAEAIGQVADAFDETDEAIKRTIMDAEQLWNSLVMPAQAGQQFGGTFGALEGSFADPTQLAAMSEQLVTQNDYLYEQLAIVQQLQGTFEGLFAAGLQGWDAFKEAAVEAILQMIVKLAALGATYAALSMIPGFAGFMEFVGAISNPMNVASKLNAGAGAGVGSAVDAIGGLNLRTEIAGSNLAVIVSRGGSQMGSDT